MSNAESPILHGLCPLPDAALEIGLTEQRLRHLVKTGRARAVRVGGRLFLDRDKFDAVRTAAVTAGYALRTR